MLECEDRLQSQALRLGCSYQHVLAINGLGAEACCYDFLCDTKYEELSEKLSHFRLGCGTHLSSFPIPLPSVSLGPISLRGQGASTMFLNQGTSPHMARKGMFSLVTGP